MELPATDIIQGMNLFFHLKQPKEKKSQNTGNKLFQNIGHQSGSKRRCSLTEREGNEVSFTDGPSLLP